jgi:hypothetical protein
MTMMSTFASRRFLRRLPHLAGLAAVLTLGTATYAQQQTAPPPDDSGPDPALANMAPGDAAAQQQTTAPAQGQPIPSPSDPQYQMSGPPPQQAPAPIVRSAPSPQQPVAGQQDDSYNASPTDVTDPQGDAQVAAGQQALDDADISADQAPPALPDYDQPEAPDDNYLWTPGYWAYGDVGYYWVPGVWIVPPYYGALWTPGYWGWYGGRYRWHAGYWGPHIGFYGGINYGYGYIGTGYFGGYWRGNAFIYNRAVTNVGVHVSVTNVYNRTVVYNHVTYGARPTIRTSYNGGRGGIAVAPRPAEMAAMHESHTAALPGQRNLRISAAQNPQAAFSNNHGRPAVAAQQQPLGANRPIANNAASFQQRQSVQQNRVQQQPQQAHQQPTQQRQQPQPRAQQSRPAAQHSAPHESSSKH